jgi:hypothetical protein
VHIYPYKSPIVGDINSIDSKDANKHYSSLPQEGDLEGKLTNQ